ncbi:unnamed protein product [Moneuplotes crassus]|uniref:Uncharacterized protein n=1 Tax=Euplotes crassus TaxID=5936 RepID=A0AAD1YAP7_EUPCR|nr:unnamed protein product [Moneuplotes crassus]
MCRTLCEFLRKQKRLKTLCLRKIGIKSTKEIFEILDSISNCYRLEKVEIITELFDDMDKADFEKEDSDLCDKIKKNVALKELILLKKESEVKRFPRLAKELAKNGGIRGTLNTVLTSEDCGPQPVDAHDLKVALKFPVKLKFGCNVKNTHLDEMETMLKQKDNLVQELDFIGTSDNDIIKVIRLLDQPGFYYKALQLIDFGKRSISIPNFIKISKWVCKTFSSKLQNEDYSNEILKHLFCCRKKKEIVPKTMGHLRVMRNTPKYQFKIDIQRKLHQDDYKMMFLMNELCGNFIDLQITESSCPITLPNKPSNTGCCKYLKAVSTARKEITSFKYLKTPEEDINFSLLLKSVYFLFILNLSLSVTLPFFLKHDDMGKGLKWECHVIFGVYIIISIFVEICLFCWAYSKKIKNLFYEGRCSGTTWLVFFQFCVTGAVGKIDIYTDVATIVEIYKHAVAESDDCLKPVEVGNSVLKWVALYAAIFIFCLTLAYQIFCLVRPLFCKIPKKTFNPLISNTVNLLVCSDHKLLGMTLDSFGISFYERIGCGEINAKKLQSIFKLIFEDLIQQFINVCFLVFIYKQGLVSKDNTNDQLNMLYYVLILSLTFGCFSIACTMFYICFSPASTLRWADLHKLVTSINGNSQDSEENRTSHQSFGRDNKGKLNYFR